jgi:Secretion system C-terminal sorting domain
LLQPLPTKTFGDSPFQITSTYYSTNNNLSPVTFTSSNTSVATISGSTVTIVGAGTTTINAQQTGNSTFNPATSNAQTLTVNKAFQNINFPILPTKTFGDVPFTISATGGGSGNPVTLTSSDNSIASISGNTVTIHTAGAVSITANQAGNSNYLAAGTVSQGLTINKLNQTVNFTNNGNVQYGDAPFSLIATGGATNNPITFSSFNTSIITILGNTATIVGVGTCNITASQAGNVNYNAGSATKLFTVAQGVQNVVMPPIPPKNFGDAPFTVSATGGASGNTIVFSSNNTSVATVSGNTVTIVGGGVCNITAVQAGNALYFQGIATQELTVGKTNQTITFNALSARIFGDAPFALLASASSSLPVSYASSNTSVATVSGNTVTIVGAGTTIITASQAGNNSYNVATNVAQTLTVGKANQTITFNALPARTFGDAPFALSASASSSLPVSYASSNTSVATVSGNTVTIVGVGSTTITASQAGNSNYNAATDVTQVLTVGKTNQTINFPSITDKVYGESPITLNAVASSNLTVSYSITTTPDTGVASLSDNIVTFMGLGSVSITASQAGNGMYEPAPNVVRTFNVVYPTSTSPNISVSEISVYPNPSKSGIFEVSGLQSVDKQQVIYQVIDALGKVVLNGVWADKDKERLDLQKAVSGIYTLVLQGSKNQTDKKIVKQ